MLLIILTTTVFASMHTQPNHGAMPNPYAPQAQPAHAQPPQMQGTNTVPFAKPPPLNQNMPPHAMPPHGGHGGHPGMAAGQDCEQILDPNFCTGPAMDGPGFICSWQGNECDAINPSSPKGQCKMLSNDQAACTMQPDCHWEEFECEYGGQPLSHEQQYPPAAPAPAAPAAPGYPAPAAPAAPAPAAAAPVAPGYPAQAAPVAPGYPAPAAPAAAAPVAPGYPAPAAPVPAHPAAPMPGAPAAPVPAHPAAPMPGAHPAMPGAHPAAPGAHPGAPPAHHGPPAGPPPASVMPQDCRRLMEPQCFGPSMKRGEVCMYDAEDFECRSRLATDVEAICKQFDRDPIKCDANKDCFYDQLDLECSEMKFPGQGGKGAAGTGRNAAWNMPNLGPAMSYVSGTCSNYKDLHSCAGAAQCFWDATANLCINALQAANVCHVLNTPQYCSTNLLCRWQGTGCSPAAGHLRKAHEPMTSQNTSDWNRNLIFAGAASVLGLLMGLALSWAQSKYTKDNTSNEDYRDIMMDINSRQVV